mmetsp:Transcript_18516/g.43743  ORF Transcript_18516/g.43743 Transcript_18516/m.43743 type:complete len:89 (-) Transcript_18516:204-470(-)
MRHIGLVRFLFVTSFTSNQETVVVNNHHPSPSSLPHPTETVKCNKLHSVLARGSSSSSPPDHDVSPLARQAQKRASAIFKKPHHSMMM